VKTLDVAGSDMLKKMEFDDTSNANPFLRVTFNSGKVYDYQGVDWKLFQLFVQVEDANRALPEIKRVSIGRLFHYSVRMHTELYPAKEHKE
jgi:hypothetical protein